MFHNKKLEPGMLYCSCTLPRTFDFFGFMNHSQASQQHTHVYIDVCSRALTLPMTCAVLYPKRYIQTDIRGYSPAPGDLAYPDKLVVAGQVVATEAGLDPDTTDSDSVFDTSGTEVCSLRHCVND